MFYSFMSHHLINRREFIQQFIGMGLASNVMFGCNSRPISNKPNIVWFTCEDLSSWLGCYGDAFAITPNIDKFAKQGVRYSNAFATASVCAPSRSTIIQGMHATCLGTQHLRSQIDLPHSFNCFTKYLRDAGYYCTNNAKQDYNFKPKAGAWDESNNKAHWRNRNSSNQPFFSVFNSTTTHLLHYKGGVIPDEEFYKVTKRLDPHERHNPDRKSVV